MSGRALSSRFEGPIAGLDRLLFLIVGLVWLNLCWTALTLLGGVLLGLGPATVAAHEVATRWLRGEREVPIAATMWAEWRRHFRTAGPTVALAIVLTASLAATWWIGRQQPPLPGGIAQALSTVGLLLTAVLLPHLSWVIARTRQSPTRYLLTALAVGLGRPLLTLALLVITIGWPIALTLVSWPGLIPVCGVSVPALGAAWCVQRVFPTSPDGSDQVASEAGATTGVTNSPRP